MENGVWSMDEVLLAKSATLERCLRRIAEEFSQILLANPVGGRSLG
jgi:hypothetical protein